MRTSPARVQEACRYGGQVTVISLSSRAHAGSLSSRYQGLNMSSEGLLGYRVCCRMRVERKEADGEVPLISQRALNPLFAMEKQTKNIHVFIQDAFSVQQKYLRHIAFYQVLALYCIEASVSGSSLVCYTLYTC